MLLDFKNMTIQRNDLIKLFATHTTEEIKNNPSLIIDVFKEVIIPEKKAAVSDLKDLQTIVGTMHFLRNLIWRKSNWMLSWKKKMKQHR